MNTEILEITKINNSPFQIAKLDDERIVLLCGNYRMELEDKDTTKLIDSLEATRWDAIGLLMEAYIENLLREKIEEINKK